MLRDGDAAKAVGIAEAAIVRLPEGHKKNEALQIQLGRAQLLAGMKEEGRATLRGARDHAKCGDAERCLLWITRCMRGTCPDGGKHTNSSGKDDEESKPWTLAEKPQSMLNKSVLTIAAWDTMGWILYKQRRLEEAEMWLKAAWLHGRRSDYSR